MTTEFFRKAGRVLASPRMAGKYACWQWHRLIGRPLVVRIPHGARVSNFRSFSEYWCLSIPTNAEIKLFERILPSAKVVGDIGANVGTFTLIAATLAPAAQILSIEPAPSTNRLLEANIRLNQLKNVRTFGYAVCDQVGTVEFTDEAMGSQNNSLVRADCLVNAAAVQVPATTLDQLCSELNIKEFDFLKIDTEGAEPRVLSGAESLPKNKSIKTGLIELSRYWLSAAGTSCPELRAHVRHFDYDLYHLTIDGNVGPRFTDEELRAVELTNALMIPN